MISWMSIVGGARCEVSACITRCQARCDTLTQRNISFQLFRCSLIYIRLRLNNSKMTFGQVKDYVSTIRHPYFQIRQGYWKISGSYWKLNATYCELRASCLEISASKRTLLPCYHFATTSKTCINKGLLEFCGSMAVKSQKILSNRFLMQFYLDVDHGDSSWSIIEKINHQSPRFQRRLSHWVAAAFYVRPAWAYAIGCKSRTSPDSGNR